MYQETSNSVVWNMLHYEIGMLLYNILKFAFMFQHRIFKIYPLGYVKSTSLQCLTISQFPLPSYRWVLKCFLVFIMINGTIMTFKLMCGETETQRMRLLAIIRP